MDYVVWVILGKLKVSISELRVLLLRVGFLNLAPLSNFEFQSQN